ncbi:MAG: hypothetical protein OXN15_04755 [Chloroflexota bacterium]|nr:hypothetical protein [Chloroflexota bacterium]MDE2968864.1 hypothetical protein [Chloroflexota bacterium]
MPGETSEDLRSALEDELERYAKELEDMRGLHALLLNMRFQWPQPHEVVEASQFSDLLRDLEEERKRVVQLQQEFYQAGWEKRYAERVTSEHLQKLAIAVMRQGRQPWQFVIEEEVQILVKMQLIQNQLILLP